MLWDLWSQSSNIVELWRMLVASRKEESFACRRLECFKEGRATWICREFRANYIHIYVSQWVPREQHELLKSYIEKRFFPLPEKRASIFEDDFSCSFQTFATNSWGRQRVENWLTRPFPPPHPTTRPALDPKMPGTSHRHNFDLFRFAAAKQDDKITLCRAKMSLWQLIRKKGIRAQQNVNTD